MTWTGQTFTVGQILTAAQMNNLQADITALANGDIGAPPIGLPALNDGIAQGILSHEEIVTNSTSYVTLSSAYIYLPANASTLQLHYDLKLATASGTGTTKAVVGATSGTEQTTTIATYAEKTSTVDVSALSEGFILLSLQGKHSTGAVATMVENAGYIIT